MLVDQAIIFVRSGKGGNGCISLRREKYVPKGGPDGGDGGRGGDVIFVCDGNLNTLLPLTPRPHYRAKNGMQGSGRSMHGADGAHCIVKVPPGTVVYDHDTGEHLAELTKVGERWIAARGGAGGYGNEHFKSATNQTPREATDGEPWVERTLRLELKLIADIGLIGLPNAGKSTMLRAISRATPKVADYPFTTLSPQLGIAEVGGPGDDRRLVIADIPGLIEGAADGAGLGHDFLRHVERTRVLVHILDVAPIDGSDPVQNYETIRAELHAYAVPLAEKRELVVFNKIDLLTDEERDDRIRLLAGRIGLDEPPLLTSGVSGLGRRAMLEACWQAVRAEGEGSNEASTGWMAQD